METAKSVNSMKCPYMVDENGDFKDCIGKCCMAYAEYDSYPFPMDYTCTAKQQTPVKVSTCRRLPSPPLVAAPTFGCYSNV